MPDPEDPRKFFSAHHHAYVTSPRHARGQDLSVLIAGLEPQAGQRALDVATGGGHTALRLAESGMEVTATDITPEMLQDALALASERGLRLIAVEAPAEALPFPANHFHRVSTRRAAHHFRDVPRFLEEARRVLVPGGRLGISDMTGSAAGIDWLNQLERLRDPSHYQAWDPDAWYRALVAAGFVNIVLRLSEEMMTFLEWLTPVEPGDPNGRAALHFLSHPDAPYEFVRGQTFVKQRILIWAEKPE